MELSPLVGQSDLLVGSNASAQAMESIERVAGDWNGSFTCC